MLSSHPKSLRCDIEKGFITCSAILTVACNFGVGVWVYFLISSPFPYIYIYIYMCLCVFIKKRKEKRKRKKKEILSVVKLSHIGNVWYWEGVYHLLCDTNCRMQYWCWSWSVFPCLIPLPLYICAFECVYQTKKKRKERYSVLSSLPKSVRCDIEKGFITCSAALTTTCSFGVGI